MLLNTVFVWVKVSAVLVRIGRLLVMFVRIVIAAVLAVI